MSLSSTPSSSSSFDKKTQDHHHNMKKHMIYLVRHGESMGNITRKLLSAEEDILTETGKEQALCLGSHFENIKFHYAYSSDYPRAVDTMNGILLKSKYKDSCMIKLDSRLCERHYGDFEGISYKEGFQKYNSYATSNLGGSKELSLHGILQFEIPNAELIAETVARMKNFFIELFDNLDNSVEEAQDEQEEINVLVVSHSFALVSFMNDLSKNAESSASDSASSANIDFTLTNWDPSKDLKIMRNVSYMKIGVERKYKKRKNDTKNDDNDADNDDEITKRKARNLHFLIKHETSHLDGISTQGTFSNFAKETNEAKQFSGCIQQ